MGESLEVEVEGLKKHDEQFHHFLKKGRPIHLNQNMEDHLQKEEENHFQKNEEDQYYLCKKSKVGNERIQFS